MDNEFLPRWVKLTLAILLIIFLILLSLTLTKHLFSTMPQQTMQVSAEGKITAVPDLATVSLGVTLQGTNTIDLKNLNNAKVNQIIAFVKQQNIDSKDIQTSQYTLSPTYQYDNGKQIFTGYQTTQTITVRVHGIDKSRATLEKILDGAVNNGANEVRGLNFSFSDPNKLIAIARQQAIQTAKNKAKELTTEAGLTLGKVINIIDSADRGIYPQIASTVASFSANSKSVAPNIEPGDQEITENITLLYQVY